MASKRDFVLYNYSPMNAWKFFAACVALAIAFGWLFVWYSGMVIANGFWSTFFAIFTGGLWSFYLLTEKILIYFHLL